MAIETVNQKPVWFGRGLIVVLLILIPVVKFGGFEMSRAETGDAIIYTAPLFLFVVQIVLGTIAAIAATYFWVARSVHPVFRLASAVFIAVSLWTFALAPTVLLSRLTLTSDSLEVNSGLWFRPTKTEAKFSNLVYMAIVEDEPGRYALLTYDGDGNETRFHIGDLLKAALPDVLERAGTHDILIADGPDGGLIPLELMP